MSALGPRYPSNKALETVFLLQLHNLAISEM